MCSSMTQPALMFLSYLLEDSITITGEEWETRELDWQLNACELYSGRDVCHPLCTSHHMQPFTQLIGFQTSHWFWLVSHLAHSRCLVSYLQGEIMSEQQNELSLTPDWVYSSNARNSPRSPDLEKIRSSSKIFTEIKRALIKITT